MDQEFLNALRCWDENKIKQLEIQNPNLFDWVSPQKNTILHMATRFEIDNVVNQILNARPSLLYVKNKKGETPLHIAARGGNPAILDVLIKKWKTMVNQSVGIESGETNIFRTKDNECNTPLHIAVRNNHEKFVWMLVREDVAALDDKNSASESPLSIAVDANLTSIACDIIKKYPHTLAYRGKDKLTLLHSAVKGKDYDVMVEILNANNKLNELSDGHGRKPLHYAAASGNVKMTQRLTAENAKHIYEGDNDGETPLHFAAKNGQLGVLKMLLRDYPDAVEVLDNKGHSILHLAARYGNVKIVKFVLKLPEMEDLINSRDEDGNTPLHLAAKYFHSNVVYVLSRNPRINIRAANSSKLAQTALQIVESSQDPTCIIPKYLTFKALKWAYAKRGLVLESSRLDGAREMNQGAKKMAQTLTVIATLIATSTFAAPFSMPWGYKGDGEGVGLVNLVEKKSFQTFIITDTIAMTSSMTAAVVNFLSFWRGNNEVFMDTLPMTIGLIWLGLISMALAFVSGMFAVLSNNI